ncbi:Carboxylesterase 2 [Myxococcaceae bacterium]|nr:Carboxylesterase 2 [Myxococcaceae bacterium]
MIALHGWGASAHDLFGLAPYLHGGEALVLCPQGPLAFDIGNGVPGYGWFPLSGGATFDADRFEEAVRMLAAFVDEAIARYPVEKRKIVLLGFSQGGVMAYALALRDPSRFAGLAALSSWLPPALAGSISRLAEHELLPTLVQHGTEDPMIPIEKGRESRDALRGLGVSLSYSEYEMGHEIRPEALRDLLVWLDDKVLQPVKLF